MNTNNQTIVATVIIPAAGEEDGLFVSIAGMSWLERIAQMSMRADAHTIAVCISRNVDIPSELQFPEGISVIFLSSPAELAAYSSDIMLIMSPSVLPDISFMKTLLSIPEQGHAVMPEEHPDIFALHGNLPVSALPAFFTNSPIANIRENIQRDFITDTASIKNGEVFSTSGSTIEELEKKLFRKLIKKNEGFMSRHLERRISLAISRRLVSTSITPNQMTIFSVMVGLAGAWLISMGWPVAQSLGALFFLAHSILDGCDGEIARIKFMESRFGGMLDFWGDNIVHAAIFSAIGYAWYDSQPGRLPILLTFLAVTGTFFSAGMVFFKTMLKKKSEGPLYTSVAADSNNSVMVKAADFLSRRDFIYLVVILAFAGHLDWFLIMTAIGSPGFFIMLLLMYWKSRRGTSTA